MPTGKAIRLEVGRILNQEDEDAFREVLNTGTSASQITDAVNLASTRFTSQRFQDYYVRESDASAAAPDGEKTYARVLTPSTGILTVSPSFTAPLANADALELWKTDPDIIDRARDRALTQLCYRWRMTPLSYLLNPDFLTDALNSTSPTGWTAANASALVTTRTGLERFSERVLRVTSSSGTGGVYQDVKVRGDEVWHLSALVQADVGSAVFEVQDLTNGSAAIALDDAPRDSYTGEMFQKLGVTFTTPATCETIRVFLKTAATSDVGYWADVALYPQDAKEFVLTSRIVSASYVGLFYEAIGDDWPEQHLEPLVHQPQVLDVGGGQVRVVFPGAIGNRRVYYQEFANYAALQTAYSTSAGRLAGDTATTDCPLEYVAWATLVEMDRTYTREWERVRRKYMPEKHVRVQRPRRMAYA